MVLSHTLREYRSVNTIIVSISGVRIRLGPKMPEELPILLIPDSIISKNYFPNISIIFKDVFFLSMV